MKKSLLIKALAATDCSHECKIPSEEEIELALAWVDNKIKLPQVAIARGMQVCRTAQSYGFLAKTLKYWINNQINEIHNHNH